MNNVDKAIQLGNILFSVAINYLTAKQRLDELIVTARNEGRDISDEALAQLKVEADEAQERARAARPAA